MFLLLFVLLWREYVIPGIHHIYMLTAKAHLTKPVLLDAQCLHHLISGLCHMRETSRPCLEVPRHVPLTAFILCTQSDDLFEVLFQKPEDLFEHNQETR